MVDLLPEALQRWQVVEAIAREHFRRSGFGEIRTPLLEATDLFCRGIGEATDVVGKEMYSFQDRGDRSCTLRPEGTARLCGLLFSTVCSHRVLRSWYAGPMFRYERPQAAVSGSSIRSVEWLGAHRALNDVEVIAGLGSVGQTGCRWPAAGTKHSWDSRGSSCLPQFPCGWLKHRSQDLDPDSLRV